MLPPLPLPAQRLWPQMIPLPPPPNRSPAQSGGRTHRRGGAEQRTAAAPGPGCPQCLFPLALPLPPSDNQKETPHSPQNLQSASFGTTTACLPPPPPLEIWGRGAPSSGLSPAWVAGQLCGWNQALLSLQPLAHSSSSLEGPRMEEKTKQPLGYSRAKNARNFLGNAVPYGIH